MEYSDIAKFLRYWSLTVSTKAASGHPTTSLSAADLISVFIKDVFRYDFSNPQNPGNDRLIYSKGHASPLYYSMFLAMGALKKQEMDGYRKIDSVLEGHPTFRFPYTEAATGSLGQGLSIGMGMAIAGKYLDKIPYRTFVLLGDGEMAEGSVWEALMTSSHYKLDNLVAILDANRLGQSEATMVGHDVLVYRDRIAAFGWETVVIDGHDYKQISEAFERIGKIKDKPYMIIAKTYKGAGISFLENKENWHGKPLPEEEYKKAILELGHVDLNLTVHVHTPQNVSAKAQSAQPKDLLKYTIGDEVATRKVYGESLAAFGAKYPRVVSLDAEVKNSTYAEIFKKAYPDRFFEMYIAEQNMAGAAVGIARRGYIPFCSTFAAFLTRAYDQIRMGVLSDANVKFVGSHAGVSIGEDGPSQMALEDLSMFRSIFGSSVLYPSDAVCCEKLVEQMIKHNGMVYMRTSRPATPVTYENSEEFHIGGSKVHRSKGGKARTKTVVIVGAGVTFFEALKAQVELEKQGISATVVDCYSVKPIDTETLQRLSKESDIFVTVEDHWFEGGLGDAVLNVFAESPKVKVHKLAVRKLPRSGKPKELLSMMGIDSQSIVSTVKQLV